LHLKYNKIFSVCLITAREKKLCLWFLGCFVWWRWQRFRGKNFSKEVASDSGSFKGEARSCCRYAHIFKQTMSHKSLKFVDIIGQ